MATISNTEMAPLFMTDPPLEYYGHDYEGGKWCCVIRTRQSVIYINTDKKNGVQRIIEGRRRKVKLLSQLTVDS